MKRKGWRIGLYSVAVLLTVGFALLGLGITINNLPRAPASESELRNGLDKAINWLTANRTRIEGEDNAVLWWMLASANADLGGDTRLTALLADYRSQPHNALTAQPWRMLFDGPSAAPYELAGRALGFPGYNLFILYGLSCDPNLERLQVVQDELATNYCPSAWVLPPHCATHQLMGLLWSLRNECADASPAVALAIARSIRRQLVFDFRVDDAYVQRALLLAVSGDWTTTLRPVWISRILNAQLADGGWDGAALLVRTTGSKYIVSERSFVSIRDPVSSFHTTVQAAWLLAHILIQRKESTTGLTTWYRLQGEGH